MKKRHILIMHGTGGSPEGNWFPWLKQELEALGHTVSLPRFPTPEGQSLQAWMEIARTELSKAPPEETILVGHSAGGTLALHLMEIMESAATPFAAAFLVAPFACELGNDFFDTLNDTLIHHAFDWAAIARGAALRPFYAGDNDPYVPLAHVQELAEKTKASLKIVAGGGHLNAESGYTSFPLLLTDIQRAIEAV